MLPYYPDIPDDCITPNCQVILSRDDSLRLGIVLGYIDNNYVIFVNRHHDEVFYMLGSLFDKLALQVALAKEADIARLQGLL